MQDPESRAHRGGYADRRSAANHHFANGLGDFAIIGVGVKDFLGGKAPLVQQDHTALRPFDRLGYVHAFDVLTKSNCSEAVCGRRIGPSSVQWPEGMCVKPFVAMIEVRAIMKLYPRWR